jgi:hypothetical protein
VKKPSVIRAALALLACAVFPVRAAALWSLEPIRDVAPPALPDEATARTPVDNFVLARLHAAGLSLNPEASRLTLIRRVTFDLTGLPPTPEEIDAFLADSSADAYEKLVDRLLASPRYGERWARHWLDVARYTESQGFEYDHLRPNGWQYRDYVINSFNADKPYNRFVQEQIAGDALDPESPECIVAGSLLVCGPYDQAGNAQANATQKAISREDELEDLISTVGQGILGLTVNCARCHSHKFDPIPQADYYRMKAVFQGVRHGERAIVAKSEIEARERAIGELKARFAKEEERETAIKKLKPLPVSYVGVREQPVPTRVLKRGDVKSPLDEVRPGGLSAVTTYPSDLGLAPDAPEAQRRVRFAEWVIDPRNPLTARVIANRVWLYHFGQGIVSTPSDFGQSGGKPSHPELLDWLATYLMRNDWSLKALHRVIVCSAAYRQSSEFNSAAADKDAEDALLWRFKPRRLEAEEVRDALLVIGGAVNWQIGGPSFRPFDIVTFNSSSYFPKDVSGAEFDRRTIYRANVNSGKDPLLDTLDCPDPSVRTPRRMVTITPLQALSLMNNPVIERQSERLAARASAGCDSTDAPITRAYLHVLGRTPTSSELLTMREHARSHGLARVCWTLLNSTEFMYVQ